MYVYIYVARVLLAAEGRRIFTVGIRVIGRPRLTSACRRPDGKY